MTDIQLEPNIGGGVRRLRAGSGITLEEEDKAVKISSSGGGGSGFLVWSRTTWNNYTQNIGSWVYSDGVVPMTIDYGGSSMFTQDDIDNDNCAGLDIAHYSDSLLLHFYWQFSMYRAIGADGSFDPDNGAVTFYSGVYPDNLPGPGMAGITPGDPPASMVFAAPSPVATDYRDPDHSCVLPTVPGLWMVGVHITFDPTEAQ